MGFFDKIKDAQQQAQEAMANAGGGAGAAGMPGMGGDMAAQIEYRDRVMKLNASGVEAPATIDAIRPTGATDVGGGQEIDFDITITPAGGTPYPATVRQHVLPAQLETLSPGQSVTARYDPENPTSAMLSSW